MKDEQKVLSVALRAAVTKCLKCLKSEEEKIREGEETNRPASISFGIMG